MKAVASISPNVESKLGTSSPPPVLGKVSPHFQAQALPPFLGSL